MFPGVWRQGDWIRFAPHVVLVGGTGPNSFDALLANPRWELEPDAQQILTSHRPGPDDVTQLIYTSGTTGEPKGVMHTANTLMANIVPYAERLTLGSGDVVLMASPMRITIGPEVAAPGPADLTGPQANWARGYPVPRKRSSAAPTSPSDSAPKRFPRATGRWRRLNQRTSGEPRRLALALLLSLLIHELLAP